MIDCDGECVKRDGEKKVLMCKRFTIIGNPGNIRYGCGVSTDNIVDVEYRKTPEYGWPKNE